MSAVEMRDRALLVALRMAVATQEKPDLVVAHSLVLGAFHQPDLAPTKAEAHWVRVLRTAIDGEPGDDE